MALPAARRDSSRSRRGVRGEDAGHATRLAAWISGSPARSRSSPARAAGSVAASRRGSSRRAPTSCSAPGEGRTRRGCRRRPWPGRGPRRRRRRDDARGRGGGRRGRGRNVRRARHRGQQRRRLGRTHDRRARRPGSRRRARPESRPRACRLARGAAGPTRAWGRRDRPDRVDLGSRGGRKPELQHRQGRGDQPRQGNGGRPREGPDQGLQRRAWIDSVSRRQLGAPRAGRPRGHGRVRRARAALGPLRNGRRDRRRRHVPRLASRLVGRRAPPSSSTAASRARSEPSARTRIGPRRRLPWTGWRSQAGSRARSPSG